MGGRDVQRRARRVEVTQPAYGYAIACCGAIGASLNQTHTTVLLANPECS